MVEPPDEPSLIDRARSIAHHSYASPRTNRPDDSFPAEPLNGKNGAAVQTSVATPESDLPPVSNQSHVGDYSSISTRNDAAKQFTETLPPPAPPPPENDRGDESASVEPDGSPPEKSNIMIRFYRICKAILFSSWINVLLVFVPAGIAVQIAHLNPIIIFAMNAVAIVPLAGLLSHATESVASEMGDTVGSLMNVTFGNAVELIILYVPEPGQIRPCDDGVTDLVNSMYVKRVDCSRRNTPTAFNGPAFSFVHFRPSNIIAV